MPRHSQLVRVYRIIELLEANPHGLSVTDLRARLEERNFEVEQRTVYRDIELLKTAGFPLEQKGLNDDNGSRWTLERNARINNYLVFNARELFALYLAQSMLTPLHDTPFCQDLLGAFKKIEDKLGDKSKQHLDELSKEFHFEPGPRWGLGLNPDVIDTVWRACTEKQTLKVLYFSANSGTTSERQLGPHFIYFARGSVYLVAEEISTKEVKIFSLPRITEATMLETSYEGIPIDPNKYFENSFGIYRGDDPQTIRLSFAPNIASYIKERRWHSSQRVVAKENGFIELTLEVGMTPELTQWILGFGPSVEVLGPQSLIDQIVDEAAQTIQLYKSRRAA